MAKVFLGKEAVPILGWTEGVPVDEKSLQQLRNIASLPFIHQHVAVMPDVHLGKGATVGSVIPTVNAIIPAAVGVDIGCGMCAVKTSLKADQLPDSLAELRHDIERSIPVGNNSHKEVPKDSEKIWYAIRDEYRQIEDKHPLIAPKTSPAYGLGTLGGGNHFIEVCLDTENYVWVMLHSGSRNIGNRIGNYFIEKAKEEMLKYHIKLPDTDLSYLPEGTEIFKDYVQGVLWAQEYAKFNRKLMLNSVLESMRHRLPAFSTLDLAVNCHHNYVQKEHHYDKNVWVTRKGAVSAREGELGIIPGSMGARSFIVRGKGNKESFTSCSHGAGRIFSRTEAKKRVTLEQHIEDTKGVECRKDEGVLDESPRAYKDIDAVIAAQADLIDVVAVLKQVLCVKG